MNANDVSPYINVARIVKPHGRYGEVIVAALDDLPFSLRKGQRVFITPPELRGPREWVVEATSGTGASRSVKFKGIDGLNDAEGIIGKTVLANRSDVPQAVRVREVRSCVGREVFDAERGYIGRIAETLMLPANDVWRVCDGPFGEVLVPIIPDVVKGIPRDGRIDVHLLPGLIDE